MTDWTAGYMADIAYTYGYYAELNPQRLRLAFLNAGLVPPETANACELGFGQGITVNLHAAAGPADWAGTDFNPAQAAFAQDMAAASKSGALLSDEGFAEFCTRPDLPDFDYIALHGIWSWVSDENRHVIVDFIRRKLRVGGVLYVSYNTQPGWAAMAPMRDLLAQHAEVMGTDGAGILSRVESALGFADQLMAANPLYARANPQVADRLKHIRGQNRQYVAHEYFNRIWQPMSFAHMSAWMEPAKLSWACSANYLDAIDLVNLTAEQQKLLADIPDPTFRQSVRDFCVNQQFRKDYWVKGARRLSPLEQAERLRAERVMLVRPRANVKLKANGALGEATLQEAVYGPILDQLAEHKPLSLGELEQALKPGINFAQILQAVMILTATGVLMPVQADDAIREARKRSDRLNSYIIARARGSADLAHLASPVTGGGVSVGRFPQLFLLARAQGHKQPADWAQFVWSTISMQGQRLIKEGKMIESAEENIAELTAQAEAFQVRTLPIFKTLKIA